MDFFKAGLYVINLDRRPERYEYFKKTLPFDNNLVKRVSAVDGLTLNVPKNLIIRNKYALACRLSHIKVMKEIINNENIKDEDYALVFEDDPFYVDNFMTLFEEYIKQISRLDSKEENLIYIGGRQEGFKVPDNLLKELFEKKDKNTYLKKKDLYATNGVDYFRDRGTFVLIYNKKACKHIVEIAERTNQDIEIDTFLNWIYTRSNKIKIYDMFPHLIFSPMDYLSDIQGHNK
jgi:GR25 family glycosyltransferase involved in LPS biosynthesis